MADNIKHIDPREFKELGFLQEANRLFFHPHGLALEMTRFKPDETGTWRSVLFGEPELVALRALLAGNAPSDDALAAIQQRLDEGRDWMAGDCFISGVWDYRDDPEGVYYGDWDSDSEGKVEHVRAERRRHYLYRARMFGQLAGDGLESEAARIGSSAVIDDDLDAGLDIEPTSFVEPRASRPAVEWEGDEGTPQSSSVE